MKRYGSFHGGIVSKMSRNVSFEPRRHDEIRFSNTSIAKRELDSEIHTQLLIYHISCPTWTVGIHCHAYDSVYRLYSAYTMVQIRVFKGSYRVRGYVIITFECFSNESPIPYLWLRGPLWHVGTSAAVIYLSCVLIWACVCSKSGWFFRFTGLTRRAIRTNFVGFAIKQLVLGVVWYMWTK